VKTIIKSGDVIGLDDVIVATSEEFNQLTQLAVNHRQICVGIGFRFF
jgi:hypothetical protein